MPLWSLTLRVVAGCIFASIPVSAQVVSLPTEAVTIASPAVQPGGRRDTVAARDSETVSAVPTWDINVAPFAGHARVAHYVEQFTGPSRERITARLERGTRYEPMIRARMRAGGLPEDMYYLALVESGFDNHAYSRA
ncbi:MAG: hypothetical protein H0W68_11310, partial [Gemmatimonadaceae bacterium]|nr:hypothetical protein [Gemmatimonadaceae bacterium]